MDQMLNETDVRAVVTMLGQALNGDGDFSSKRAGVLAGIAELVGGNSWVWGRTAMATSDGMPKNTIMVKGGFSEQQFACYLDSLRHPALAEMVAPIFGPCLENPARLTRHRIQIHPAEFYQNSLVSPLFAKAGIGPALLSCRKVSSETLGAISFFRPENASEFTDRDVKIAHIILSEIEWLYENSWPEFPDNDFSTMPFCFTGILNLLIKGDQRKEIADQLNLSIHTVSDYIKAIYKHHGVHSQAELMHRFTRGDGGDLS